MGQVRHGSASTTHVVRAAIQRPQTSLSQLSKELGINPKKNGTPSASFISTFPRSRLLKASSTCSYALIAQASLP